MGLTPSSSEGGGGPAAGTYQPVGSQSGVTLDTTTYSDPVRGGGAKLATLVFGTEGVAFAVAQSGDSFPRWLFTSNPRDGLYFSGGAVDPYTGGAAIFEPSGAGGSGIRLDARANDAPISLRGGATSECYWEAGTLALYAAQLGVFNHAPAAQPSVTSGTVTPEQLALALQTYGALGGT